jgi:chemotaxis protein MotB
MDRVERRVTRGGHPIELTSKEFALLEYLMRNAGRRVTRAMIIEHVWNLSFDNATNLVDVYIAYSSSQVDQRKVGKLAMAIQVAFQELGVFPASSMTVPVNSQDPVSLETVRAIEDAERKAALAQIVSPKGTPSAPEVGDLSGLRDELQAALALEIERNEVALRTEPDGLAISLREIGFFDSGSAAVRANSRSAFGRIASFLARREYRIRIEGHTDDVPIHNSKFADNWELSTARATELVRLLIVQYRFAPQRLSAAGFAEYHPVASNATPETRAQNRRVDIVIVGRVAPAASPSPPLATNVSQPGVQKPSPSVPAPVPQAEVHP